MNGNKSLLVMSVISMFILLLGSTFSYFNISAQSSDDAVGFTAMKFDTSVEVTALYAEDDFIPMDDSDVMTAYARNCIDNDGYGACQAYEIEVTNNGLKTGYDGAIKFNISGIENLKYLVLDENSSTYVSASSAIHDTDLTLGDNFELDTGESITFVLIIWLSNIDDFQDDVDAGGNFSANVTYRSTSGSRITGTFNVG